MGIASKWRAASCVVAFLLLSVLVFWHPQPVRAADPDVEAVRAIIDGMYALEEWHTDAGVFRPPQVEGRFTVLHGAVVLVLHNRIQEANQTTTAAYGSSSEDELTRLGYSVQMCLTDFGETAEAVVQSQLKQKRFDCILIGAGVRTNPSNFMLFEKLINVVHEHAPQAKLCFNTMPSDTAAAVKRWL